MPAPILDFESIIRVFVDQKVDFIIVGGVCGALHGAPINTLDIDFVHSREPENLEKVLKALEELGAYYRELGNRRLKPKRKVLAGPNPNLFTTNAGPLDLLGTIDEGRAYSELLTHTTQLEVFGMAVLVLNLETLIEVKRRAGRPKDLIAVPILERALKERQAEGREDS